MEERKYTFHDRYQKVKYANITAEELEVLNISYNKEHYMFDQQHQRNNTVLFCGLESEKGCATDFIADTLYVFAILGWRYTFRSLKDSAEI